MQDEAKIEQEYIDWIDETKVGVALKLYLAGLMGWPDRTVLLKGGVIFFIEFKDPKGKPPSPQQRHWERILKRLGFDWYRVTTLDQAKKITRRHTIET